MRVDGYWALEVVKGLEIAIETEHVDTVCEREEWIEVLQRELQIVLSHALNPKKNLPQEEEENGN
jgi:hypothetical protein